MQITNESPAWSRKLEEVYPGAIVDKSIARKLEATKLPRFVAEYLIAMFCKGDDVDEGIRELNEQLRRYMPERKEKDAVLDVLEKTGEYKLIDHFKVKVSLSRTERQTHKVNIPTLGIRDAYIYRDILEAHPRLLTDGIWGRAKLRYIPENKQIFVADFKPFQLSSFSLQGYVEGRSEFAAKEWIEVLVSSVGLNPQSYTPEQRTLVLSRLIPMVEKNTHLIELGPPGTGKTYTFDRISAYTSVISGSVITAPALFYNATRRTPGILALYDVVVFDEIDKVKKGLPNEVVNKLLKFMESGTYDRLGVEIPSGASVMLVGNLPPDLEADFERLPLFRMLPEAMQHKAFFDRLSGLLPGWDLPIIKGSDKHLSRHNGFAADYFCEVLHALREKRDYQYVLDSHVKLENETIRDEKSIKRLAGGLLKLLFPKAREPTFTPEEITFCVDIALRYRQRVIDQRYLLYQDPHDERKLAYSIRPAQGF